MLTKQLPIDQFKAMLQVFRVREAGRHRWSCRKQRQGHSCTAIQ
jgi:hypothetical protein